MSMFKSHSLSFTHTLSLTLTLSHSHSFSFSHSFNLSFTHSRHTEQLLFSCLCSKVTLSLTHSLTISIFHSHTHSQHAKQLLFSCLCSKVTLTHSFPLSLSHSLTLDMLNEFCFHVYAQNSLIIGENGNVFFLPPHPPPHRATDIELVPS